LLVGKKLDNFSSKEKDVQASHKKSFEKRREDISVQKISVIFFGSQFSYEMRNDKLIKCRYHIQIHGLFTNHNIFINVSKPFTKP